MRVRVNKSRRDDQSRGEKVCSPAHARRSASPTKAIRSPRMPYPRGAARCPCHRPPPPVSRKSSVSPCAGGVRPAMESMAEESSAAANNTAALTPNLVGIADDFLGGAIPFDRKRFPKLLCLPLPKQREL